MKKHQKLFTTFIVLCILLIGYIYNHQTNDKEIISSLLLENIEALADGEGVNHYGCYGRGVVDCPSGHKVEIYIGNLSLDLE